LKPQTKLSTSMTQAQFDNGYWYATEIKQFAKAIGIPSVSKLRKDELEKAIKLFLRTKKVAIPTKRTLSKLGIRDVEKALSLTLPVVNYTSNRETKDFIMREANKLVPDLKRKSGARYRLNRWREEQLTKGVKITYGDLIRQYVAFNQTEERFARIPSGRYINFLSDFLAAERGATREQALRAWKKLKKLDAPKNYRSWARLKLSKQA
jgi:SAP domain-containing new25